MKYVLVAIVVLIIALVIFGIIRETKKGKTTCSGHCDGCSMNCQTKSTEQKRSEIDE